MNNYIPVIGLEIHVELKTKSKMFCQCKADYFGRQPNSQVCPVCLGMPGALPVPNIKAIEYCQLIAKALNCKIAKKSKFDRKHYFYPDLPKGYQISQYDEPFATKGKLKIEEKSYRIQRVHLEEDTGKLIHVEDDTLIDFNRSGVPLVEIVTEPDFDNSTDVKKFLEELQVIVRYLGVSDADMEKGSVRLEPNISLKKEGENALPKYKVEVKNINSFNFVKRAIDYEIERQSDLLNKGATPDQETRGFNENKGITFSQRTKEYAHDYRYFPEPDIPPMVFDQKFIESIKVPELATEKITKYGIREQDAFIITRDIELVNIFEGLTKKLPQMPPQTIANLIVNKKLKGLSLKKTIDALAKEVLELQKLKQNIKTFVDYTFAINKVIDQNPNAVEDYKKGKEASIMFLVGQVMKELKGQADAKAVRSELEKKLKS